MGALSLAADAGRLVKEDGLLTRSVKADKIITSAGKTVDISKGFKIRTPNGDVVPFRAGTDVEAAKTWVKNFYAPDSDFTFKTAQEGDLKQGILSSKNGKIKFNIDQDGNYQIKFSEVRDAAKGKGIGAGLYRQLLQRAEAEGKTVYSDTIVSKDAVAVWRRLKDLGFDVAEDMSKVTDIAGGQYHSSAPVFKFTPKQVTPETSIELTPKLTGSSREGNVANKGRSVSYQVGGEGGPLVSDPTVATDPSLTAPMTPAEKAAEAPAKSGQSMGVYRDSEGNFFQVDDKGVVSPLNFKK